LQKAEGYICTIKSGQITFRDGAYLGVHPGRLIRGPQRAAAALAAE
jgi:N-acyl-D-aspartate/D-glutamate deacylase